MHLIVQISSRPALDAAMEAAVAGVVVDLPREPSEAWWAEVRAWQTAARNRGVKFYLQWDRLLREEELPQAGDLLAAVAALAPDALVLRDLGLCRTARLSHPWLELHAAGGCGYHNSPGLRLAETLGFRRVVLDGPIHLKDLALIRRQSAMPLEVVLPQPCPGFGHLCLLEEYLGRSCPSCCRPARWHPQPVASLFAALELLPGLAQIGVAAVRLGGVFSQGQPLRRILELCQLLEAAAPATRSKVLAAAKEVLDVFEEAFQLEFPVPEASSGERPPGTAAPGPSLRRGKIESGPVSGTSRIWLEARDYAEALALAAEWREPLVVQLTPENYAAFLAQYSRWNRRRLVWRLPPVLRESGLSFFQQAIATLKQGGFSRFVVGDWGGVALAKEAGGEIYGEQTLGIRNSSALLGGRDLGVSRVCLPPGRPDSWLELVKAAPRGSFWSYLYHLPVLTVCPSPAETPADREPGPGGKGLRWLAEGGQTLLCPEAPEHLDHFRDWFRQNGVGPLLVSLPRSGLPWGQTPRVARPPQPARTAAAGRPGPGKRQPFKKKI